MDLVALRRKVEVQFPNDRWHTVEPFRGHGKALLRSFQEDPSQLDVLLELLRLAVPSASDEEIDMLSHGEDIPRIIATADGKAALVEEFLKNAGSDVGEVPTSPIPPSPPTTTSSTSSDTSPGDTAVPGPTSTPTTGTTPSSDSPPSKSSNESKPSSETTETSETSDSP